MTEHDATFLAQSRQAFATIGGLTFADIQRRIEGDGSLAPTRRRDLLSALNRLEKMFGCKLGQVAATAPSLRDLFENANPVRLGVSEKTVANIRSLCVKAVSAYGEAAPKLRERYGFNDAWIALLNRVEVSYCPNNLHRLAAYCSFMDVAPEDVMVETLLGFATALEADASIKKPRGVIKNTISAWNRCGRTTDGWPDIILGSPFKKARLTLPLAAFPESFQREIATWSEKMRHPDPLDPTAPTRPRSEDTIEHRVYEILRYASALVRRGDLPIEEITEFSVLFTPERFKSAVRDHLDRHGGETKRNIFHFANNMKHLAAHHCQIDAATLEELASIAKRLDPHDGGRMAPKNRELLRQFDDPRNVKRLLYFPDNQVALAKKQKNPYRAAKRVERALTVALMMYCGLRSRTMRLLEHDADFTWSHPNCEGVCHLYVPPEKTKTKEPLEYELTPKIADLLRLYLMEYRPNIPGAHGPYLVPGQTGGIRSKSTFREGIKVALLKDAGLIMHPHLIRHAIAKIAVERDPGAYLAVSLVLGHSSPNVTLSHYLGTEGNAAARHLDRLLKQVLDDPDDEGED